VKPGHCCRWLLLCGFVASVGLGCGRRADKWVQRRPPTFPTKGVVTMNGKGVEGAVVSFDSKAHNLTAVGRTDSAGRFVLKTFGNADGAPAGDHSVRIEKREVTGYDSQGLPLGEVNRLPPQYEGATSRLTATVSATGGNAFRFELGEAAR